MATNFGMIWYYVKLALNSILLLWSCVILHKELRARKTLDLTLTSKWMLRWSLGSMICIPIFAALQLATRVEEICRITIPMVMFIRSCAFVFFQNYQLSQIYFCFSNSTTSSDKGFPNYLFVILYLMGFAVLAIHILIGVTRDFMPQNNCSLTQLDDEHVMMVGLREMVYFSWCIFIGSLYCIKLNKFNKLSNDPNKEAINIRISFILNKITFFNVGYNSLVAINAIIMFCRLTIYKQRWLVPFESSLSAVNMLFLAHFIYLAMEHNRASYLKFLKFIKNYTNCCCFKRLIKNAEPFMAGINEGKDVKIDKSGFQKGDAGGKSLETNTRNVQSHVSPLELDANMSERTETKEGTICDV